MPKKSTARVQFDHLIDRIYDASLDTSQWNRFLNDLCNSLGAESGCIRIVNAETGFVHASYSHNRNNEYERLYNDHLIEIDPWMNSYVKPYETRFLCTHHVMDCRKYKKMEFYNEFVKPQGTHFGMGGSTPLESIDSVFIAVNRGPQHEGFEQCNIETLKRLSIHLRNSFLINRRLELTQTRYTMLEDALDMLNTSALIVDKHANVLFANRSAEELIHESSEISLKDNRISLGDQKMNKTLQDAIALASTAYASASQAMALNFDPPGKEFSYSILINRLEPSRQMSHLSLEDRVMVTINEKRRVVKMSMSILMELYEFSLAEARLVSQLCKGMSLDEAAAELSVSKNTVRTQIRSCFSKTGTSRQSELVSMINTSPAAIIRS